MFDLTGFGSIFGFASKINSQDITMRIDGFKYGLQNKKSNDFNKVGGGVSYPRGSHLARVQLMPNLEK